MQHKTSRSEVVTALAMEINGAPAQIVLVCSGAWRLTLLVDVDAPPGQFRDLAESVLWVATTRRAT